MKIPNLNLKSWRLSRWMAIFHLILFLVNVIAEPRFAECLYLIIIAALWLLLDLEEGRFQRVYDEANERWYQYSKELNSEWEKRNLGLAKECDNLREQLQRIKDIYHIKTEDNFNYENDNED